MPIELLNSATLCTKGCGRVANWQFKNGSMLCELNGAKCPAVRAAIGRKNKEIRTAVDPITGLTTAQLLAVRTKEAAIQRGEPDPYKVAAVKMAATRTDNGSYVTAPGKAIVTKQTTTDETGVSIQARATAKMVATRRRIDHSGLSNFQRASHKSTATRLADVDSAGRNGFDRMWLKAGTAHIFPATDLYFRSTLEQKWIQKQVQSRGIDWVNENVKNSTAIPYTFNGTSRQYLPDYLVGNLLYEIKSAYTWDKFGADAKLRGVNAAKLNAAQSAGWTVKLIIGEVEYDWNELCTTDHPMHTVLLPNSKEHK